MDIIQKEVQEMMAAGVIRPSDSLWSSPVVMVKKRNGTKSGYWQEVMDEDSIPYTAFTTPGGH